MTDENKNDFNDDFGINTDENEPEQEIEMPNKIDEEETITPPVEKEVEKTENE